MSRVISLFLILFYLGSFMAQTDFALPREEPRPYYQLQVYPSGFDRDSMENVHQNLLKTPKIHWKRADSISYMLSSISLENYDEAMKFYDKYTNYAPESIEEFHLLQYLLSYKRRFPKLTALLQKETNIFPENKGQIKYRMRLKEVESMIVNGTWSLEDSIVFSELKTPGILQINKGSKEYETVLIPLIKLMDEALRVETKYEFSSNQILGLAFFEFGVFLRKKLSTTDAFIALSVGRFYDKLNFDLTDIYKDVRSEMNAKKYTFPSMRRVFPKQSQGVFSRENIEKRQLKLAKEEEVYQPYYLEMEADDKDSLISRKFGSIVMLVGTGLLFFFVIFFIKAKRN